MCEPLLARNRGEARPLRSGVELVDDVAPPLDHLPLDVYRAGCGRWDGQPMGGEVECRPEVGGQFEHPHEHGWYPLAMGDSVLVDERERRNGVEFLHDDGGTADGLNVQDGGERGRVIDRRWGKVDGIAGKAETIGALTLREAFSRRRVGQWIDDSLGPTGGAGAVEHRGAHPLPRQRGG